MTANSGTAIPANPSLYVMIGLHLRVMGLLAAKLAEVVATALARAAGVLIRHKARAWLEDRNERQAYERALAGALNDVGRQFPSIAASFFDEHFLHGPVAEELALYFTRHQTPDPERIAKAYAGQFSASSVDALSAPECFLAQVEEHMKREDALQELLNARQIERGSRILERLDQRLGWESTHPKALPAKEDDRAAAAAASSEVESAFRSASGDVLEWPQTLDDGQWMLARDEN